MMGRKIHHVQLAKSLRVATALLLGCLCGSVNAWAANSPLDMIRSTTNQALAVLADSSEQGKEQRQQQIEKMWEIVLPRFDTDEIAKRSLGVNWQTFTEDQRKEFARLYIQLVKKNYGSTLERYTTDAQFFFDREDIDGDHAEVYTRIMAPSQENPFSVVYRLHRVGDEWLIHDVVAENVSLVQNYRNQFSRIIAQSSAVGLLDALKRKIAELEAT
jgi:phospholipid transport system substrate-binding protein